MPAEVKGPLDVAAIAAALDKDAAGAELTKVGGWSMGGLLAEKAPEEAAPETSKDTVIAELRAQNARMEKMMATALAQRHLTSASPRKVDDTSWTIPTLFGGE